MVAISRRNYNKVRLESGGALIIFVFVIVLVMTAFLLKVNDPEVLKANQDKRTMQTLQQAKVALIAWSVSHANHPGQMPFPDRNADGNYDGNSDCNSPTSTFNYSFLMGQLPVIGQTNPCTNPQVGLGEDFKDADGNRLWFAVSRNLTHIYENGTVTTLRDPVINPDVVNYPAANPEINNYPAIASAPTYNYPWLKVLDSNGNLISDRVAVVIIAPGAPIGGQSRASVAPNPSEYLDSFVKGGITYSNASYTVADQAFVVGLDGRNVSDSDPRFSHPYYFNDKLIYITIDELISALNNRAAAEASRLLNQYKVKTGQFPYAALLDSRQENHMSSGLLQKGLLPIDATDVCSCESYLKCTCSFKPISKVTFKRGAGTWAASTLSCSRYSANCNCTGAGSCTSGAEYFTCDSAGVCEHNVSGSNSFTYTVPDYANIRKLMASGCADPVGKTITCSDVGQFAIGLDVPAWFKDNLWQDFLYYEWSVANNLSFGSHSGINALLIGMGTGLTNEVSIVQNRPSLNLLDYLDSTENTDGNLQFEAFNKKKSLNYNDQPFIVAP